MTAIAFFFMLHVVVYAYINTVNLVIVRPFVHSIKIRISKFVDFHNHIKNKYYKI